MVKLSDEQRKDLLDMLIADESFLAIREKLGLGKKYNLKSLCEYEGRKILRAYQLHINNYKEKENELVEQKEILTKDDFFKWLSLLLNEQQSQSVGNLIENKGEDQNSNTSCNTDDIIEIIALPKQLPERLTGENYVTKQSSVRIVENVWVEFQEFVKEAKGKFNTIELLSLAILEFLEKYRTK